jgi:dihydroflavonol-4-reductase
MHILVTGATGLVGNNVVRMLLDRGDTVRVLVRSTSDPRPLTGLLVERALGDVRDKEALVGALEGVDWVIHSAAVVQIGWRGLAFQRAVNVEGTRNVAQAARQHGVRMIHVSSVDALGIGTPEEPGHEDMPSTGHVECPYVLSKREAEAALQEEVAKGLHAVIVNPAFMLGKWDWKPSSGQMLLEIASGMGLFAPPGGNDFCHVEDVACGILAAMERGQSGRRYILGGHPLSYKEAWTIFAGICGARKPIGTTGRALLWVVGKLGDLWGWIRRKEPVINSAATAISCLPHHFSSARATEELGYSLRPIEEAVQDAWDWFQSEGK